jgi:uncharacterized membrane protein
VTETVTDRPRLRMVVPTRLTWIAIAAILATISFTAAFLLARYPTLPLLLPVHFNRVDRANGWQFKTYPRVLMPVLVQSALALTLGAIGTLLLSRSHHIDEDIARTWAPSQSFGDPGRSSESEVRVPARAEEIAASTAAEAVALFALIWVVFQSFAGLALVAMWERGRGGLGDWYTVVTLAGVVLSVIVAVRAHRRLGRPAPRHFVAEHWRFGQLYRNPGDPALFVPTRDGSGWTINFGRPVAAALIVLIVAIGIVGPTVLFSLMLR